MLTECILLFLWLPRRFQPTVRGGRAVPTAVNADGGAQRQDPDLQATSVSVTHSGVSSRLACWRCHRATPPPRHPDLQTTGVSVTHTTWVLTAYLGIDVRKYSILVHSSTEGRLTYKNSFIE